MDLEAARKEFVGREVIYRPRHVSRSEPGEPGIIQWIGDRGTVFVRYEGSTSSKATPIECLEIPDRRGNHES